MLSRLYFPGPAAEMVAKIEKYIKASSGLPVPVIWYKAAKNIVPQTKIAAGFVKNPTRTSIAQTDSEKAAKKPNIGFKKLITSWIILMILWK